MNVTIIGCGYVGSAVARYWGQKLGRVVTATTTSNQRVAELKEVAKHVVVMKSDNEISLRSVIQNQYAVLLSVAPVGNQQVEAEIYEETYLRTAKNLVAALKLVPTVKQLIYTSSCSVYGARDGEWVNEESPVAPVNGQGQILCDTEQVLLEASGEDLNVCILRLGGIYGPGREMSDRFGRFAGTTLPGTGNNFTNWSHLDDIVSAVEFALGHRLQGIYNLVNDDHLMIRELFDLVCERHGLPKIEWEPSIPKAQQYNARVSNQKLKTAGYQFIHSHCLD
jgi:nucleoside-diphosphate-sugar epimerase